MYGLDNIVIQVEIRPASSKKCNVLRSCCSQLTQEGTSKFSDTNSLVRYEPLFATVEEIIDVKKSLLFFEEEKMDVVVLKVNYASIFTLSFCNATAIKNLKPTSGPLKVYFSILIRGVAHI